MTYPRRLYARPRVQPIRTRRRWSPGPTPPQTISLGGSITPVGAIAKSVLLTKTGVITPSGGLVKDISKILAGGITPAGSLLKQAQKSLGGVIGRAAFQFVGGNVGLTTPDNAVFAITDLDIEGEWAWEDWTPASARILASQSGIIFDHGWSFFIEANGDIVVNWSTDGSTGATLSETLTNPGFVNGSSHRLGAQVDVDDGAGGRRIKIFVDGVAALDQTRSGTTNIFNSSQAVGIGSAVLPFRGVCHWFKMRDSIGGTEIANPTALQETQGATSFTDDAGRTWTFSTGGRVGTDLYGVLTTTKVVLKALAGSITPTGALTKLVSKALGGGTTPAGALVKQVRKFLLGFAGPNYLSSSEFGSNFSAPDVVGFQLGTELVVRMKIRAISWDIHSFSTHQVGQAAIFDDGNQSWIFSIHGNGHPRLAVYPTGFNASLIGMEADASFKDVGAENGRPFCIGVKVDLDNGSGQRVFTYEYSADDGATWQQLGTTQSEAGATSFFNSTAVMGSPNLLGAEVNAWWWIKVWSDLAMTNLIAAPNWDLPTGTTSHVDEVGNTWTHGSFTSITEGGGLAGSLAKQVNKLLGGGTTPTGTLTLTKVILRAFAGAITPVGTLLKQASKSLGGGSTPTGALVRTTQKSLAGNATPTGTLRKAVTKLLSGGVTPSGILTTVRLIVKALAGAIIPTGTLRKQAQKGLGGQVTPTSTLRRTMSKSLGGTITPEGSLRKLVAKTLGGVLTSFGDLLTEIPSGIPLQLKLGNLRRRFRLSGMTRRYWIGGFARRVGTDDLGRRYDAGDMDRRYETGDLNRES